MARCRAQCNFAALTAFRLATPRQRPQTASGVAFVTTEDEHGLINVVVWRHVAEAQRRELLESQLLGGGRGRQMVDSTGDVVARRLLDSTALLAGLDARSRNFQ